MAINFINPLILPYDIDGKTWYEAKFLSLSHIYEYLSSNPKPNTRVFGNELSSRTGTFRFAGAPYEESLEYLRDGYVVDYEQIIDSLKGMDENLPKKSPVNRKVNSFTGSRVDGRRFAMGNPKHMVRIIREDQPKFITIDFNLAYPHYITKAQIENRGKLTINLIKMLELNGYRVRFNTFELSQESDEICYIKVMTKAGTGLTEVNKLLYATISVELFRRLFFAIKETLPVRADWGGGYGVSADTKRAKYLLGKEQEENYIMIGWPDSHGISGENIYTDAERFFESINLDKYIKVKK